MITISDYRIYSRISRSAYKSKEHFGVYILSKIGNPGISLMSFYQVISDLLDSSFIKNIVKKLIKIPLAL
jgi:hypothetical protein